MWKNCVIEKRETAVVVLLGMQKPPFVENQIYHIYNREVEKRDAFLKDKDYFRFIHDLFEFNNENSALNVVYYLNRQSKEVELQ